MKGRSTTNGWVLAWLVGVLLLPGWAGATAIDLNDFYAFPDDAYGTSVINVAADGSSAGFVEDPLYTPVYLSNDPGLGDPIVIVAGTGVHLLFDYVFVEGAADDDEFGVFVIDADTGGSAGAAYEFFLDASANGSIDWDLSALTGKTLGLQFQLSALPGDPGLDSTLGVSNVQLVIRAVPEPATGMLFGLGLGVLGWRMARQRRA